MKIRSFIAVVSSALLSSLFALVITLPVQAVHLPLPAPPPEPPCVFNPDNVTPFAPVFNDCILDQFVPVALDVVDADTGEPFFPVPGPTDVELAEFVKDKAAAVRLGKALFWDMSVGSDGVQACASCHFLAGADSRSRNQLSPGLTGTVFPPLPDPDSTNFFDTAFQLGGPGYLLVVADFPLNPPVDPANRFAGFAGPYVNDVVSSMGVDNTTFQAVTRGVPQDTVSLPFDPVFNDGIDNTRRVEPRNTPTVINAAYNLRQFWDGRANHNFNGRSPSGPHDPDAWVFPTDPGTGTVVRSRMSLPLSSLASQALGPPLSHMEMSALGRAWHDVGRKMVPMTALVQQRVDFTDSVLGDWSNSPGTGLVHPATTTPLSYQEMIQAAFQPRYWASTTEVVTFGAGTPTVEPRVGTGTLPTGLYTQMEANFSLFFGLAIQLYESTLISNDSKFDRVRRGDINPNTNTPYTFTAGEQRGLEIFSNIGQNLNAQIPRGSCVACHLSPAFTGATVPQLFAPEPVLPGEPVPLAGLLPIEPMQAALGGGLAGIAMSSFPLPDEQPFPAGFDLDNATSPMTGLVEIVSTTDPGLTPGTSGPFTGTFLNPNNDLLLAGGIVHDLIFAPAPVLVDDPTAEAVLTVGLDGVISFEVATLNLANGFYDVIVGGVLLATIEATPGIIYDLAFYNIGVLPTGQDLGLGGAVHPDGTPVSFAAQQLDGRTAAEIGAGLPVDPGTGLPLQLPALINVNLDVPLINGAFKTPGLRNVAETAPYFHNGGQLTLRQVVEFYNRGGDFHELNINELDPEIANIGMTALDIDHVVAFLHTLTDQRVLTQAEPFDHPQLLVPDGANVGTFAEMVEVGAAGGPATGGFRFPVGPPAEGTTPPPPADTDHDGVPDTTDLCPGTSAGEPVDTSGCSASQRDTDGDGLNDAADLCPGTTAGATVDANGCSAAQRDTDGDGVSDAADLCPSTTVGATVDANGCATRFESRTTRRDTIAGPGRTTTRPARRTRSR